MTQNKQNPIEMVVLELVRGVGNGPDRTEKYEVPLAQAASLLDGLRWVRQNLDPTLAFRYSCISANACKECMMLLDGEVVYACTERLSAGKRYQVQPLANKERLRDLITEIAPPKERLDTQYPVVQKQAADNEVAK